VLETSYLYRVINKRNNRIKNQVGMQDKGSYSFANTLPMAPMVSPAPDPTGPVLIGKSQAISKVRSAIHLVAGSNTAVLISGESGTGKDVVANLIHHGSPRQQEPFVALNCAALPRDVIENELFGHEQGAFTGAISRKSGCFELANGGTLFFDEIAEMHADTQAKLLRAIESKSFRRLGGKEEINVDVRTLAATNKDIPTALRQKELREDLYYRFSVIEIALPALRERKEDVPLLVEHFLAKLTRQYEKADLGFTDDSMEMLIQYNWPGNVRELKNVIERCVVTCREDSICPELLPERISMHKPQSMVITIPLGTPLRDAERAVIRETLAACDNNKSEAARILMLSRRGLQKKLRRYGTS
jgi:DNA-binding NtrC family response regulator